jgi:hypothetical protein
MSKNPRIEPRQLEAVVEAVAACWEEGSPVTGQSAEHWSEIAHVAIRRIRSFDRRGIARGDRRSQVRDIARGLVAALESDAGMVGPLIIDYEYVAEKSLEAFVNFDAGAA